MSLVRQVCPKCRLDSGDEWSQCSGDCPMPASPHYRKPPWFRWPRGRYNGDRIVGFEVKVRCDITYWRWIRPTWHELMIYGMCIAIGPLRIWIQRAYSR